MMISEENLLLLQAVPVFKSLESDQMLSRLVYALEEVDFPAGYPVLKQGEIGSSLYIVIAGGLEVHLGGMKLAHLQVGDYFGEMSLFDCEPHSASVTTLESTKCLVLSQEQMNRVIYEHPEVGLQVIRLLCDRIYKLNQQISVWLRGLLTIAWADGEYNQEEKCLIEGLVKSDLDPNLNIGALKPISPQELAVAFAGDAAVAENFLRTAVIVALANGTYSDSEDKVLREFCQALQQKEEILEILRFILIASDPESQQHHSNLLENLQATFPQGDVLHPVRSWLDNLEINTPYLARFLCQLIPPQCPFERDIVLFGRKIVHIPPMCKLNPLYEQLVGLRFRALCYLADVCKEDISRYV